MSETINIAKLIEVVEAVKDVDWSILNVIIRFEGESIEQIAELKTFLMKFNPDVCLRMLKLLEIQYVDLGPA